jgi:hypothetical protein
VSASGRLPQTLLLPNQGSVPTAPPSGNVLLYAANGEPMIEVPGATQGTPLFRGFKNWLRNGTAQLWSNGGGTRTAPLAPIRLSTTGYATYHADGWCVLPEGATVTTNAAGNIAVAGLNSIASVQVNGGGGCTGYRIGQRLPAVIGATMATMAKYFTFSGFIFNGTGTTFAPQIHINVANSANNFSGVTTRVNTALAALAHGQAVRFSVTFAANAIGAIGQGLEVVVYVPNGSAHTGYCTFGGFQLNEGGHALELEVLPQEVEMARSAAWLSRSYGYSATAGGASYGGLQQVVSDQYNANQAGGAHWASMALNPDVAIYAADGTLGRVSDVSYNVVANPSSVVAADISTVGFRSLVATGGVFGVITAYTYHYQASCELL